MPKREEMREETLLRTQARTQMQLILLDPDTVLGQAAAIWNFGHLQDLGWEPPAYSVVENRGGVGIFSCNTCGILFYGMLTLEVNSLLKGKH